MRERTSSLTGRSDGDARRWRDVRRRNAARRDHRRLFTVGAGDHRGLGDRARRGNASAEDAGAIAGGGSGATGATGGGGVPTPTFFSGPVNGDPSKPVVSIPDVACGGSKSGLDAFVGANFGGFPVPGNPNWRSAVAT
jgi:hypothetical protein